MGAQNDAFCLEANHMFAFKMFAFKATQEPKVFDQGYEGVPNAVMRFLSPDANVIARGSDNLSPQDMPTNKSLGAAHPQSKGIVIKDGGGKHYKRAGVIIMSLIYDGLSRSQTSLHKFIILSQIFIMSQI